MPSDCLEITNRDSLPSYSIPEDGKTTDIYQPLNISQREFRLLRLVPGLSGDPDDTITTELFTASLDDPPIYETISYVWGDSTVTADVNIAGKKMSITTNLYAALVRMRLPNQPRILWADALCINQMDIKEREDQVQIMGVIYSKCLRVLVWLGPEELGDVDALALLARANRGEKIRENCTTNVKPSQDNGLDGVGLEVEKCRMGLSHIAALTTRSWWSRIWTVQEVVLPPGASLFSGKLEFDLMDMIAATNNIYKEFVGISPDYDPVCISCLGALGVFPATLFLLEQLKEEADGQEKPSKAAILIATNRSRQATDPRDKIYGIMGLLGKMFGPDYSSSVKDVYTKMASDSIQDLHSLVILGWAVDNDLGTLDLPSWVPNWSCNSRREDLRGAREPIYDNIYNASGGRPVIGSMRLYDGFSQAALDSNGFRIATIQVIGDTLPTSPEEVRTTLISWLQLAELHSSHNNRELRRDSFWRTVMGNVGFSILQGITSLESFYPIPAHLEEFFWSLLNLEAEDSLVNKHLDFIYDLSAIGSSMYFSALGRRFFVSDTGLFGMCHLNVVEGDEIWILRGGKMPLILRQVKTPTSAEGDYQEKKICYRSMGPAYVHSVMDDEMGWEFNTEYEQEIFIV